MGWLRKVRMTKIRGAHNGLQFNKPFTCLEKAPPEVGKVYEVLIDNGARIATSRVTEITDGHIATQNSLYKFEVLDQISVSKDMPALPKAWLAAIQNHQKTASENRLQFS